MNRIAFDDHMISIQRLKISSSFLLSLVKTKLFIGDGPHTLISFFD